MRDKKLQMRLKATAKSNILHHKYTLECLHFNIMYAYVFVVPDCVSVTEQKVKFLSKSPHRRACKPTGRRANKLEQTGKQFSGDKWNSLHSTPLHLNKSNRSKWNLKFGSGIVKTWVEFGDFFCHWYCRNVVSLCAQHWFSNQQLDAHRRIVYEKVMQRKWFALNARFKTISIGYNAWAHQFAQFIFAIFRSNMLPNELGVCVSCLRHAAHRACFHSMFLCCNLSMLQLHLLIASRQTPTTEK